MSDNIPLEIQMEIIKKVSDVKSLLQFRSVSKPWKSFIDSSEFINGYGARHTHPHSFILTFKYTTRYAPELEYVHLAVEDDDDDDETFKVQLQELPPAVVSPLIKQFSFPLIKQFSFLKYVGDSHGLVCMYGPTCDKLFIWNPSIRKSFAIGNPSHFSSRWCTVYAFGVRPDTSDPTVVKIIEYNDKPWHVEVFTLSSGVWNVIPSSNLLRQSIQLSRHDGVAIHRFVYWAASDTTHKRIVVSFDLISKEFKVIDLPDSFKNCSCFVSKLRESLVVYGSKLEGAGGCDVWVMEHDLSFKKLFSIAERVKKILGFRESGEPIIETPTVLFEFTTFGIYDPCSHQINNLGIAGASGSFNMGSNKESLLLLNHSDLHIYCDDDQ